MYETILTKKGKALYQLYCGELLMHATYDWREAEIMMQVGNDKEPGKWYIKTKAETAKT